LVSACDVVVLATPSIYLSETIEKMTCNYEGKLFVSAIKGIVPKHNDVVAHYLETFLK
jgi:glycerol-3-phosphate dehydrogenase (NAD(P)+)